MYEKGLKYFVIIDYGMTVWGYWKSPAFQIVKSVHETFCIKITFKKYVILLCYQR